MDIQTRKIEFVRDFLRMENEELLTLMEKLLRSANIDSENKLQPMSVEELNKIFDYYHRKTDLKLARKLTTQIISI